MNLSEVGVQRINALLDGIEQNANDGILGKREKNGFLEIKTGVLQIRQTLKTESDFDPDGGNAA